MKMITLITSMITRKRARLQLKVPIDETIGRSLGNESLE